MSKKYLEGQIKSIDKEKGIFSVLASSADVDRDGETIDPKGWDLKNFLKNPVILWGHNYSELPIGIAEEVKSTENGLEITGRFASDEANPKAGLVRRLYEEGIQRAVSVGFIPTSRDEKDERNITGAELLELSFVTVPANPNALALAYKKGFNEKEVKELFAIPEKKTPKKVIKTKKIIEKKKEVVKKEGVNLSKLIVDLSASFNEQAKQEKPVSEVAERSGEKGIGSTVEIPLEALEQLRKYTLQSYKINELILTFTKKVKKELTNLENGKEKNS